MTEITTVKCFRCKKQRDIFDVMYIPIFDNRFFSRVKYLCGYCICELANFWPSRFHTNPRDKS